MLLSAPAAADVTGSTRFIPTFIVYYGGGPNLVAGDEQKLARYDLIDIDRWRYSALSPSTWAAVKALNPNVQIYLYEMGPEAPSHLDSTQQLFLNGLGRHNVSRGHSMGSLSGNNPGLFLLNSSGNRIYNIDYSNPSAGQYWYLMDFGGAAYQSYWVEAVRADIANQPWVADGIFTDNCTTISYSGQYSSVSTRYPTSAAWSAAMNSFAAGITAGVRGFGQKLWCNRSMSTSAEGASAWLALDASANAPDVVLEEGAFAVQWGSASVQFFAEDVWKRQVDLMGAIRNSKLALMSHTVLSEGQWGTDNWGRPAGYWQILWYSLGSFLLGKNDTLNSAYFMFNGGSGYNRLWWYDEYDRIDLGRAIGPYQVSAIGPVNVYWREFEKGYVYVNPTPYDASAIILPQASRQLTHDNLSAAIDSIPIVTQIALVGHNAAVLLKTTASTADTQAPTVPTGLAGSAVSSTQINLTWNASTDNVGVTGYYVYLDNVALATTATTSFTHTGLTAGTSYSYRVSAYDAVPNHSAWTATPVAVTTPPAAPADTQAPTVPTGLVGTAVSSSRIDLTWNPSTDNVGVTGYYVYLNDAPLATTTQTSFSHTGLSAGTTYRYRVSAYDAIPNHSAWTATPVSVTIPAPDTTPPSVSISSPSSGSTVSGTISVTASAADNVGVAGVQFKVDGVNHGAEDTTPGYSVSVNTTTLANGSHTLSAVARDAAGNVRASAPVTVTVWNKDKVKPKVSITSPASGATVSGTITIAANASDNVGVAGVQFKYNGINLGGEVTSAPYAVPAYTTSVPNGTYTLTAVARDAAGNQTTSAPVSVTVANP
ncbi:MAG: hypothetical protein HYS35_00095 [Betaproteobacteria bacterium]|nr:hypothetical protein [Betaproteobacteria bacterium]